MWRRRVEWHPLLPIAQVTRRSHPHMSQMEDPRSPNGRPSTINARRAT
jgi:hypothetical protein